MDKCAIEVDFVATSEKYEWKWVYDLNLNDGCVQDLNVLFL